MSKPWKQVTIVGCGLIGGSFAMALRRTGQSDQILGWDTDAAALEEARKRGIIDKIDPAFDREEQSLSDLIYFAMPVRAIINFFKTYPRFATPGCLITDSGSTKVEICAAARKYLTLDINFVGGHPMAGSHLGGIGQARSDLFQAAQYLLVISENQRSASIEHFRQTLDAFGCRVEVTTAEHHDRAIAYVSHLPQLLSSALAATVKRQIDAERLGTFAGPAYRDLTRLSSSPWGIWQDILATNAANVDEALSSFIDLLQQLRRDLQLTNDGSASLSKVRAVFEEGRVTATTPGL